MIWVALILPGMIVGYALFLRPVLRAMPQLKDFYAEADGFWEKVWALCGNSLTMAWSYGLAGIGFLMQWLEPIAGLHVCQLLGATEIDVYGADWTQEPDFDGKELVGTVRTLDRWIEKSHQQASA